MALAGGRGEALASPEPAAPLLVGAEDPAFVPRADPVWSRAGVPVGFFGATSFLCGLVAGLFGVVSVLFGVRSGLLCVAFGRLTAAGAGVAVLAFAAEKGGRPKNQTDISPSAT